VRHRVLFVCLGNICRSPTAEGLLRALVAERGLEDVVEVDSAGTGHWHVGDSPDQRMREAAERRGYRLTGRARQVRSDELGDWDMVVAMDRENLADLRALADRRDAELRLFSEFLPGGSPVDVPDPYYGGPEGFDRVIDLVEAGCARLLDELLDGVPEGSSDGSPDPPLEGPA
jgi:protein-tyrosine phosphatase